VVRKTFWVILANAAQRALWVGHPCFKETENDFNKNYSIKNQGFQINWASSVISKLFEPRHTKLKPKKFATHQSGFLYIFFSKFGFSGYG
jgi:hypothetical protein